MTETALLQNANLKKITFEGDAPDGFVAPIANGGYANYTIYYQPNAKGFTTPKWNGYKAAPVGSEPQIPMDGDFEYETTTDQTVVIVKYYGNDPEVTVPSEINGMKVTAIGEKAFAFLSKVVSVKLPDTITDIGYGAFACCSALVTVNLPQSLKSIEDFAFYACHNILEASFPTSLTKIGSYAFSNCQSLTHLSLPATVTEIGDNAFYGAGITSLELEEGIETIGKYVFASTDLQSVTMLSTMKTLHFRFHCKICF